MDLDPYFAALLAGFAVALPASVLINQAARRLPAGALRGGLAGGQGKAPPLGGFALLLGFALAPFIATLISERASEYFLPKWEEFLGFLGAVALVFLTGLLDDWRAMKPWQKLTGQMVAGVAVYAAGYQLNAIGLPWGGTLHLGILALPMTLLWVAFFTNAVNLIDGKDGLATGVSVFAAAALAAVAAHTHHPAVGLLFVGLAGAGLGFLPFNLPPASLYIGDGGALVFGFLLSTLSIRGATGEANEVFIGVPLLALGFPVLDTLLSATRRLLDRRDPFAGDHDHIHHRFEALNLGPRGSLALLYLLSAAFATAALGAHYVDSLAAEIAIVGGVLALVALVLAKLGYVFTLWNSDRVLSLRRRLARTGRPSTS
ncbi:MAG TPA: MraY family glycosyltransferase [Dehalococcoidia bacterium]|nr:MraY family glycosyltransferase [Dehalococcoidia bacterium]